MRSLILAASAVLLLTSTAQAERDPAFESGLSSVPIEGSQVLPGPSYQRNQLVVHDSKTATTVGGVAALAGTLSLAGGWVVYIARQNYRLQVRSELANSVSGWETQGMWAMSLGGFGAANLTYSEYALLPPSKNVPLLAWFGGVAGVVVVAVGVGFAVGGQHCSPLALRPGSQIPLGCLSGTADAAFGPMLLMSSAPLLNLPIAYLLRSVFASAPESLTFNGTGVSWAGRF